MIKGLQFKVEVHNTFDSADPEKFPWRVDLFIQDKDGIVMGDLHSAAKTPQEALLQLAHFWFHSDAATQTITLDDEPVAKHEQSR